MALEKERKTAYILFVNEGKSRKEISQLLGVSEHTVGTWVNKFNWIKERTARNASSSRRTENIKAIITSLSEERIDLTNKVNASEQKGNNEAITELRSQISRVDDSVSKWNRTLMTIENENKITLAVYLAVMEMIFSRMRLVNTKLYIATLDFQEQHVHQVTSELG